jgi:biopolymer transport protein ExbD
MPKIENIVFLLLIFFMVTTVFVVYRGIMVERPRADMTERLDKKRGVTYMWISAEGRINIDDHDIGMDAISTVIYPKRLATPRLIVSVIADVRAPYGTVADAMRQLREADALLVNFATLHAR